MSFESFNNAFSLCFAKTLLTIFLIYSLIWTPALTYRETKAILTICV